MRRECPWDRAQTLRSIRQNLIEEVYELIEGIDEGDKDKIEEELGDLLFLSLFAIRIARDERVIKEKDFYKKMLTKYQRRHPHVFGKKRVVDKEDVLRLWQERKKGIFDGIPETLPSLIQARLIQERASRYKFDWSDVNGPLKKIFEEIAELQRAIKSGQGREITIELGDLLFSIVNLSRFLKIDAELALRATNRKFIGRFQKIIHKLEERGRDPKKSNLVEMDRIWEEVKKQKPIRKRSDKPRSSD
ncbi:MAG: nucleoside triphosphate pyrophosphohydrolase [candidate division WOR-3 bacterium]